LDRSIQKNNPVGSAFFIQDSFQGQSLFFVVTARHIVDGAASDLFTRVQIGPKARSVAILLLPRALWVFHSAPRIQGYFPIDVAVMRITLRPFIKAFLNCPSGGNDGECGKDDLKNTPLKNQLVESPSVLERVLFLGFPEGEVSRESAEPLARGGVVAYTSSAPNPNLLLGGARLPSDSIYLLDATSLPGNSGGPVLREPRAFAAGVYLWGLVTGSSPGRNYTIVTRPEKIAETLAYARTIAKPNDQWSDTPPSLPLLCNPNK
jgi:hypothetical protein